MSYCRFSDDSDVYVYPHVDGYLCCCACRLMPKDRSTYGMYKDFITFTSSRMLVHLQEHEKQGQKVPQYAIHRLESE